MPKDTEFKDVSSDVAAGAGAVAANLRGIVSAAEEADAAHAKLSKTQADSLNITNAFSKAMDSYSKSVNTASRSVSSLVSAGRGIGTVASSMAVLAASSDAASQSMGRAASGTTAFEASLENIKKQGEAVVSALKDIDKEVAGLSSREVKIKVTRPAVSGGGGGGGGAGGGGGGGGKPPAAFNMKDALKKPIDDLSKKEKDVQKLYGKTDARTIKVAVEVEKARTLKALVEDLDAADVAMFEADLASVGLAAAMDHLAQQNTQVSSAFERAEAAVLDTANSYKTLAGEMDRVTTLGDLVKKTMLEGRRDAENFAEGLGMTGGKAIAAGVAMVYLLDKVGKLVEGYLDASKAIAQFNVQSRLSASTTIGADYKQLSAIRNELSLTKEQAGEFYEVLRAGSQSGVVSVAGLAAAAKQLQNTFGGDQTEKLKEFVSLLESIPSLETDMSITASLDDQAASLFALAKEGKITALLDLQAAGLLGGMDMTVTSAEDVKMLNEQQKATKVAEDIHDFLVKKLMPSIGPKLALLSKGVAGVFGTVGMLLGIAGTISAFSGTQIVAQNATTAAVIAAAGAGAAGRAAQTAASAAQAVPAGGGLKSLFSFFPKLLKGIKTFAAGINVAAVAAMALAAGLALMSWGFKKWGEHQTKLAQEYRTAGYDLKAANADVKAEVGTLGKNVAGFAAAGASIGAIASIWTGPGALFVGAIGAAIGAAVGFGKWLIFDMKNMSKARRAREEATKAEMLHTEASREFRDSMARAIAPNEKLSAAMKVTDDSFRKSALSFQRQISALDKVAGTAKVQLSELEREVAGIELKNLVAFGGTLGDFNRAVEESIAATTSRFELLDKGLQERRKSIAKDANMTNEQRRIALTQLKEYELRATEDFVTGIGEVISQLMKTPGIAQAEMRRQLKGQRTDFAAETGAMSGADLRKEINDEVGAALDAIGQVADRFPEMKRLQQERSDVLTGFMEEARKDGKKLFEGMSADAKKNFEGIGADLNRLSVEDFKKIGESAASQLKAANEEIEALSNGLAVLEGGSVRGLRANAAGLKKEFDEVSASLDKAKSEKFVAGSDRDIKNREKIKDLGDRQVELDNKIMENDERIAKWSQKQGEIAERELKWTDKTASTQAAINIATLQLSGKIEEANALRAKDATATERAQIIIDRVTKAENSAVDALRAQAVLMKKGKDLHEALTAAQIAVAKVQDTRNKDLEEQVAAENELIGQAKELVSATNKRRAENIKEAKIGERNLSVIEARAEIDRAMGKGLENIGEQNEANRKLAGDILKNNESMLQDNIAAKHALEEMKANAPEGLKFIFEGMIEELEKGSADLKKESAEAEARLWEVFNGIEEAISAAMEGPLGKAVTSALDLSDVRFEFAEFSEAAEDMLGANVAMAQKAARTRGKIERQAIEKHLREEEKAAAELAAAGRGDEATERLRSAQVEAQYRMEKSKTDEVKAQLDAVKKAADIQKETVNILESGLEAELDYLSYIGAHYSTMLDIQGDMVALARQRYEIEQDVLNNMKARGVGGQELLRQETAVRKSWLDMQKKSVGVQKDVMEKMLGAAFGQLAGEFGAIKGLNRTSAVMGIQKSRAYSASGLAMGTGPGGGGTIAERALQRQLAGLGGRGGPKRLTAEEDMANAMHGTEDATVTVAENTAATAADIEKLTREATTPGSLFVHDNGAHAVLSSILAVAKIIAENLMGSSDETKATETTGTQKEKIEKAIAAAVAESKAQTLTAKKIIDKNIAATDKNTKAVKDDALQPNERFDDLSADLKKDRAALSRLSQTGQMTPEELKKYGSLEKAIESLEATIIDKIKQLVSAGDTMRANVMEQPFAGAGFDANNPDHLRALRGELPAAAQAAIDALTNQNNAQRSREQRADRDSVRRAAAAPHMGRGPGWDDDLRGQAAAYNVRRSGSMGDEAAESLKEAAWAAGTLRDSFHNTEKAIDKETSGRWDAIDEWEKQTKEVMASHARAVDAAEKGKADFVPGKAFEEMEKGVEDEADRRRQMALDWQESMKKANVRNEAEYQRKAAGFSTPEEEQAGYAKNLEAVKKQFAAIDHAKYEQKAAAFRAEHKTSGFGEKLMLEGKGPASKFGQGGGALGSVTATSLKKAGKGSINLRSAQVLGGVSPTGEPNTSAMKPSAAVVSGRQSTQEGQDKRAGFQARDGSAMAPTTTVAHMAQTGAGAVAGGATTMKITGELRIISDNPLLDGRFATMVAQVVNTAEVKKSLENSGQLMVTT